MSAADASGDRKPEAVVFAVRFFSVSAEATEEYIQVLTDAVGLAVGEINKMYAEQIEIIEPDEVNRPTTEVRSRDEV